MNWEAIGAVAELAGASGVIVSLIYLARQISMTNKNVAQNTTALFNQGEHASLDGVVAMNLSQVESRSVAELMLKAYSDFSALDAVDRFRFSRMLFTQFESHQTFFLQNNRNSAGPDNWATWSYYSRTMDEYLKIPSVANWWIASRGNFDPGYVSYINEKLQEA
jgi:hypothetical protein